MWNKEKNYLLILGADQYLRQRAVVGAMRAFAGPIVTACLSPETNRNRMFDDFIEMDEHQPDRAVGSIKKFNERFGVKPAGVIPCNDFVMNTAAAIAAEFDLPGFSKEQVSLFRNKDLMKSLFLKNNIPCVQSHKCADLRSLKSMASKIGFPVVIKPVNLGGSIGVVKAETMKDVELAYEHTKGYLRKFAKNYDSDSESVVIEKYIESVDEISVEVIAYKGKSKALIVTDKFLGQEPYFSEVGHLVPSIKYSTDRVKRLAERVCQVLGITYGISHVEIKVKNDNDLVVLECGARPAGDGIVDIAERVLGENLYQLHCASYLGTLDEFKIDDLKPDGYSSIHFLHPEPGQVSEIKPLKQVGLPLAESIVRMFVDVKLGDNILPALNWATRNGAFECYYKSEPPQKLLREVNELSNHFIVTEKISEK